MQYLKRLPLIGFMEYTKKCEGLSEEILSNPRNVHSK